MNKELLKRLFHLIRLFIYFVKFQVTDFVFNLRNSGFIQELKSKHHYTINGVSSGAYITNTISWEARYCLKKRYCTLMDIIFAKNLNRLKVFIEKLGKREFETLCLCRIEADEWKSTVLHYIVTQSAYADLLEVVLRYVSKTDIGDINGATPLIYAIRFSNTNAIRLLVDRNVKINSQDFNGWSALHEAVFLENFGEKNFNHLI